MCDETATVRHNDGKGDETLEQYFGGLKKQIGRYESIHYESSASSPSRAEFSSSTWSA